MSNERKIKAYVQLAAVNARIDELERAGNYYGKTGIYYRNRLRVLGDQAEKLEAILNGTEGEEVKLSFKVSVPENEFAGLKSRKFELPEILQFMKKEYLIEG